MSRHPLGAEPTGLALRTHINARNKTLFDVARFSLTDLGGTANDVTAVLVPDFDGDGLVAGMTFGVTWAATNTGGMTLKINDAAAAPLLDRAGAAIPAGGVTAGLRSTVEYVGGAFRVLTGVITDMSATSFLWVFEADGTWTAPDGFPDDRMVWVEAWGAGGGGGSATSGGGGSGGGGGAYIARLVRLGDLGASVTATVPAGGAVNTAGGTTSFGAHVFAYGGGRGGNPVSGIAAGGGGGGGTNESGGNGGISGGATDAGAPGYQGGGSGGSTGHAGGLWGGGGGTTPGNPGGRAVWGGGGGAGHGSDVGGESLYGGNGGGQGVAGAPRGGGGGRNAAGGRGEIRVWL